MSIFNILVPLPDKITLVKTNKESNSISVNYSLGNVYKPERKRTIPIVKNIGSYDSLNKKLKPNINYFSYVPGADQYLTDEISYTINLKKNSSKDPEVSESSSSESTSSPDDINIEKIKSGNFFTKSFGDYLFIEKLVKKLKVEDMLVNFFDELDSNLIIDVARYSLIKKSNVIKGIDVYFENSCTKSGKKFYDTDISKLFARITDIKRVKFFMGWKLLFPNQKVLAIDVTSVSKYTTDESSAQYGYNRDGESLPQINKILVHSTENKLPLCYEDYNGSIPDQKKLQSLIQHLIGMKYNVDEVTFLMDRGFCQEENLSFLDKIPAKYLICEDMSLKKCKIAIEKFNLSRNISKNLIKGKTFSFYAQVIPCDDNPNRNLILFLNTATVQRATLSFYSELAECEDKILRKEVPTKQQIILAKKYFKKTEIEVAEIRKTNNENEPNKHKVDNFRTDVLSPIPTTLDYEEISKQVSMLIPKIGEEIYIYKKIVLEAESKDSLIRDENAIEDEVLTFGFFGFVTNRLDLTAQEALTLYEYRGEIEQVFDTFKNSVGMKRFRTCSYETEAGKNFVFFISTILHDGIKQLIDDYNNQYENLSSKIKAKNYNFNSLTPDEILNILKEIRITDVYGFNGLLSPLSKKQKAILNLLDIDDQIITDNISKNWKIIV